MALVKLTAVTTVHRDRPGKRIQLATAHEAFLGNVLARLRVAGGLCRVRLANWRVATRYARIASLSHFFTVENPVTVRVRVVGVRGDVARGVRLAAVVILNPIGDSVAVAVGATRAVALILP